MSDEDDIIITSSDDASDPEQELPAEDDFLTTELMRTQFRKKLDLISEIEEHAAALEEKLSQKLQTFAQRDVKLTFREMAMFQHAVLDTPNSLDNSLYVFEGEEQMIASFLFGNPTFQQILAFALNSAKINADSGTLSEAESRLFTVFVNYLGTALFETVDVIREFGIPKKPHALTQEKFLEVSGDQELICFIFDLEIGELNDAFVLLSPLSLFDGRNSNYGNRRKPGESQEEIDWKNALSVRVDNVKIPMTLELASGEMQIAEINNFQVGQELRLPILHDKLKVHVDATQTMMEGALQVTGKKLHLKILNAVD